MAGRLVDNLEEAVLVHMTTVPDSLVFFTGQISYMQSRGLEVHTISSPGPIPESFARQDQAPHHPVSMTRRITPARDVLALWDLVSKLREISPTIVHSHTPKAGLLGMMAARIAKVPVCIYHIHGLRFTTASGHTRKILQQTERLACSLAHQVLCVSPSVRGIAVGDGICKPERIKVLGSGSINGVDAEGRFNPDAYPQQVRSEVRRKLSIPDDATVIGFVGRIVRDKGMNELVAAWQMLRASFEDAHLLIVGDFEDEDPIPIETRRALLVDHRIHLAGVIEDMPSMYLAMDLVVLPTYREGFPLVPMETAAMRLPIVATTVPGCVDAVVDGVTGILVPPGDPHTLRAAITHYLENPEARGTHGRSARERVLREFRPQDIWESTYSEYKRLLVRSSRDASPLT